MTRDESLQIVSMVISGWPQAKDMDESEIDLFARSIQDLDAELTTHAVLKAIKDAKYRPTVAEIRERVWMERRRLAPVVSAPEPTVGRPLPLWIKRWVCARMLYGRFGKERDLRRFPEQGDWGDLTEEVMPEGAWEKEAETMPDGEFYKAFEKFIRGSQ